MMNQIEKQDIIIGKTSSVAAIGKRVHGNCKPVLCIDTGEVFASVLDASEYFGLCPTNIGQVCNGKTKTAGGKKFCFVSETKENLGQIAHSLSNSSQPAPKLKAKEKDVVAVKVADKEPEKLTIRGRFAAMFKRVVTLFEA